MGDLNHRISTIPSDTRIQPTTILFASRQCAHKGLIIVFDLIQLFYYHHIHFKITFLLLDSETSKQEREEKKGTVGTK